MYENLTMETSQQIAELFKAFGDTTRVRILWLLLNNEQCVGSIAQALDTLFSTEFSY